MKKHLMGIVIEKDSDGSFAYCPILQGCYTQGDTYEEALENIKDAIALHIKCLSADGLPIIQKTKTKQVLVHVGL